MPDLSHMLPWRRYQRMRETLLLIACEGGDNYCENFVSYYMGKANPHSCRFNGRLRVSDEGTYNQWCDACRAADALGLPAHAHPERTQDRSF